MSEPRDIQVMDEPEVTPDSVAAEAREQVELLRQNADEMLLQLMQEQKAKLKEMITQLKGDSTVSDKITQPTLNLVNHAQQSVNKQAEPGKDVELPLNEVSRLKNENLIHLDTIVSRINQTMNDSLKDPINSGSQSHEELNNDKSESDI